MKFKLTITKDVIDKSLLCSTAYDKNITAVGYNCAFAVAYNELVPNVWVAPHIVYFKRKDNRAIILTTCVLSLDQQRFIKEFDSFVSEPNKRYGLVGRSFDIEIPDYVIQHHYGDASKAAQKIIDNPILQTA